MPIGVSLQVFSEMILPFEVSATKLALEYMLIIRVRSFVFHEILFL